MAKADVTIKLSPTDFNLIIETLEEARTIANQEAKDHAGEVAHKEKQKAVQLDNLIRQLA
jgi:hypothetical protein